MCGRYSLVCDAEHLRAYYDLASSGVFGGPRFNIAPTQPVPAIVAVNGERHLELFRWGLLPSWAKDKKLAYSTINARVETVAQKPAYREAFRWRRCLIPADGFYEWQGPEGHRLPWHIEPRDRHELFSFAGLWDIWEGAGELVRSCTILVGASNELVRPIHERMPIILPRDAWDAWLDQRTATDALQPLLQTAPAAGMRAYRVGVHVNNPNNDDPDCLLPAKG